MGISVKWREKNISKMFQMGEYLVGAFDKPVYTHAFKVTFSAFPSTKLTPYG